MRRLVVAALVPLVGCGLVAPLDGLTGGDGGGPVGDDATIQPPAEAGDDAPVEEQDAQSDTGPDATDAGPRTDASGGSDAGHDAGVTYASAVLSDGPMAYWHLDETAGPTAHDASGHGNDATYVGTVTFGATGALLSSSDTAVTLDGASGHLDAGDKFNFAGNAAMTIELWARPVALSTSYQRLVAREGDAGAPRVGYLVFLRDPSGSSDPNSGSFERWIANTQEPCPMTAAVAENQWHYVVATYDGAQQTLYYDDALASSVQATGSMATFSAPFLVGTSAFDPAYFAGDIDEVAVYGSALGKARIDAHWAASGR